MVAAETRGHGQAGWRLVRTDEDRAIAGGSVARPGYRAKLRDAGGGLHDIVVCKAVDLAARSPMARRCMIGFASFGHVPGGGEGSCG